MSMKFPTTAATIAALALACSAQDHGNNTGSDPVPSNPITIAPHGVRGQPTTDQPPADAGAALPPFVDASWLLAGDDVNADGGPGKSIGVQILVMGASTINHELGDGLEVISSTRRLSEAADLLGGSSFGGPELPDGGDWYPNVDFAANVVAWIHLENDFVSRVNLSNIAAEETDTAVIVEVTTGNTQCMQLTSQAIPYAFVELPKLDKPYKLVVHRIYPSCLARE